jgi:hypothetical protein
MIDVAEIAGRVRAEWRGRFAEWDDEPFAAVAAGAGAALAAGLGADPEGARVIDGYLRLVAEALRLRYVDRASCLAGKPSGDLLARCLLDVLPRRLPAYPAARRLSLMARTWNLGEGLLRQSAWMARLGSALVTDADDLEHLDEALAGALAPLMAEASASSFAGPFQVGVLDLAEADDEFLPGEMHAAAPAVVCVHDRLRDGRHVVVVLARACASRTLGAAPCLAPEQLEADVGVGAGAGAAAVDVRVGASSVEIAGHQVALPTVHGAHSHLVVPSGFLAVSAVDSQRLWIVESAT